ncbi:MAG: hypothetical protein QW667_08350 [Candidatus Bathyarchaeia archaeon]
MVKKKAVVVFELVDESAAEKDEKIVEELFEWLQNDGVFIPWVKSVKSVRVEGAKV